MPSASISFRSRDWQTRCRPTSTLPSYVTGIARYTVSMFVDMRGSTKLSEGQLPFDIVFLINRFVEAVSKAVTDAGGHPNQFVGDSVLAVFGLKTEPATACRQALHAAALVASNVALLNHQMLSPLEQNTTMGERMLRSSIAVPFEDLI